MAIRLRLRGPGGKQHTCSLPAGSGFSDLVAEASKAFSVAPADVEVLIGIPPTPPKLCSAAPDAQLSTLLRSGDTATIRAAAGSAPPPAHAASMGGQAANPAPLVAPTTASQPRVTGVRGVERWACGQFGSSVIAEHKIFSVQNMDIITSQGNKETSTNMAEVSSALREIWQDCGRYMISDEVLERFLLACKHSEAAHRGCGLHVVWHWTKRSNLTGIAEKGLLIGSSASDAVVPVAHGRMLGSGVYATPEYSFGKKYGDTAIICLALPGAAAEGSGQLNQFGHKAKDNIIVYRDRAQILACAAHDPLDPIETKRAIEACQVLLDRSFPGLGISRKVQADIEQAKNALFEEWKHAKELPFTRKRLTRELKFAESLETVLRVDIVSEESLGRRKQLFCRSSVEEWDLELQLPTEVVKRLCIDALGDEVPQLALQLRICFPPDYPYRAPCLFVTAVHGGSDTVKACVKLGGSNVSHLLGMQDKWDPAYQISDALGALARNDMACLSVPQFGTPGNSSESDGAVGADEGVEGNLPHEFKQIFDAGQQFKAQLGGSPHYPGGQVHLAGKKKTKKDLSQGCTAYEHVCLTVLGLAKLQENLDEIQRFNNGKFFADNPGTQLLEQKCGFTMHADRAGTAAVLRDAPGVLVSTFQLARRSGRLHDFFSQAFDRHHDPCLEGRVSLFVEFYGSCLGCND